MSKSERLGDKVAARRAAKDLGIPIVPGSDGIVGSDAEVERLARELGFPLLLKAAAGGGGRGMKLVRAADELPIALSMTRAEAKAAFGDDALYVERYLEKPRHIEVQILGDGKGHVIHLGERDCSLQRRHQKILEEGPSPALNSAARDQICETAARAMRTIKYLSGSIEFLADGWQILALLRNEHPPPGRAPGHGNDLRLSTWSAEQIPLQPMAMPSRSRKATSTVQRSRHRVPASTPNLASVVRAVSIGTLTLFRTTDPRPAVLSRIDSASLSTGATRSPSTITPLLAELIVHGKTRDECLMRLHRALDEFVVDGIETTLPLFRALARETEFIDGDYHIHWLEEFLARGAAEQ